MANTISNTDDFIDSRDVIARIDELESERGALSDDLDNAQATIFDASEDEKANNYALGDARDAAKRALAQWDEDNSEELAALKSLAEDANGYVPDWRHGATLIRDSYFEDYAREFASDIGAIDRKATWPNDYIDWPRAAEALQMDYTSVEFDGVTYWVR